MNNYKIFNMLNLNSSSQHLTKEHLEKVNVLWIVDHLGYNGFMHGAGKYYLNSILMRVEDYFKLVSKK